MCSGEAYQVLSKVLKIASGPPRRRPQVSRDATMSLVDEARGACVNDRRVAAFGSTAHLKRRQMKGGSLPAPAIPPHAERDFAGLVIRYTLPAAAEETQHAQRIGDPGN